MNCRCVTMFISSHTVEMPSLQKTTRMRRRRRRREWERMKQSMKSNDLAQFLFILLRPSFSLSHTHSLFRFISSGGRDLKGINGEGKLERDWLSVIWKAKKKTWLRIDWRTKERNISKRRIILCVCVHDSHSQQLSAWIESPWNSI